MRRRPDTGFELSDRIVTYLHGGGELGDVLQKFGGYVSSETLRMAPEFGVVLGVRSRWHFLPQSDKIPAGSYR